MILCIFLFFRQISPNKTWESSHAASQSLNNHAETICTCCLGVGPLYHNTKRAAIMHFLKVKHRLVENLSERRELLASQLVTNTKFYKLAHSTSFNRHNIKAEEVTWAHSSHLMHSKWLILLYFSNNISDWYELSASLYLGLENILSSYENHFTNQTVLYMICKKWQAHSWEKFILCVT